MDGSSPARKARARAIVQRMGTPVFGHSASMPVVGSTPIFWSDLMREANDYRQAPLPPSGEAAPPKAGASRKVRFAGIDVRVHHRPPLAGLGPAGAAGARRARAQVAAGRALVREPAAARRAVGAARPLGVVAPHALLRPLRRAARAALEPHPERRRDAGRRDAGQGPHRPHPGEPPRPEGRRRRLRPGPRRPHPRLARARGAAVNAARSRRADGRPAVAGGRTASRYVK